MHNCSWQKGLENIIERDAVLDRQGKALYVCFTELESLYILISCLSRMGHRGWVNSYVLGFCVFFFFFGPFLFNRFLSDIDIVHHSSVTQK